MSSSLAKRSRRQRGLSLTAALAALFAVVAQPSASVLHSWAAPAGHAFVCADAAADGEAALHAPGCQHEHEGAHHAAGTCVVCRSLQQTAPRVATTDVLVDVLPAREQPTLAPPSRGLIRLAHGVTAPRAPPVLS